MKVPTRFVSLNEQEIELLEHLKESTPSKGVRKRARSLLLSSKGYHIDKIANILDVHRDSVSSWFRAWESKGIEGLFDKPRSGAPSVLSESDFEVIEKLANEHSRSLKIALAKFTEKTGKTISLSTLRRVVKSLKQKQD